MSRVYLVIAVVIFAQCVNAENGIKGISFDHHDWQLVCDNTRTCRAAGYQTDEADELPVSVLLTRAAGPQQLVVGQLMIGNYGNEELYKDIPETFELSMKVNGTVIDPVMMRQDTLVSTLSGNQTQVLLEALTRDSTIEWSFGEKTWRLSDKGASAVLLKMDEFQNRINTTGALVRKGTSSEASVFPSLPTPVVIAASIPEPEASDNNFPEKFAKLVPESFYDDCMMLQDESSVTENTFSITRLNSTKLLVSALCWRAAYNEGYGYWIVNEAPPYNPVLITTNGMEYSNGRIYSSHKGRGLGDCWYGEEWTWDGDTFVQTDASSTGMCKLIAPGGAWSLPTIKVDVR